MMTDSKVFKNHFVIILISIFIFASCKPKSDQEANIIAKVNDAVLTIEDIEQKVPEDTNSEVQRALKRQLMEKWIEEELFYQAALDEGYKLDEIEQDYVREYEKYLLVKKYMDLKFNKNYRILDRDIEDYYQQNKEEFKWEDDYAHIYHLVIETRDQKIFNEIYKSKDLLEIIKTYYFDLQSTTERPIGDLGYVELDDLPSALVPVIKRMQTGRISRSVKTDLGYHFVQLIDFQKAGNYKTIDVVKDEIILRLRIKKKNTEIENFKSEIRSQYVIQTDLFF